MTTFSLFKHIYNVLMSFSICSRRPRESYVLQQPTAAKEKAQVQDRFHEPPDLRAGEEVPLPEIPVSSRPGRDSQPAGTQQRPSHHLVPEQESEAQERHGGAEEGCGDGESVRHPTEVLPRECPQLQHA